MFSNFTITDTAGILLALIISPIVFITPGYFFGWLFELFDFRKRLTLVQVLIGVVLSNAISPILLFLIYRFFSASIAVSCLLLLAIISVIVFIFSPRNFSRTNPNFLEINRYQKLALLGIAVWIIFCIIFLTDWQFGNKLYFTSISYDYTTRVSVIDAITRTGSVPPVNPGYFPGQPVNLTYLYYFWYILGSVLDFVGGKFVSAYQALIVGVAYCGIGLVSTMALYLRLRNPGNGKSMWKSALLSAQLFLISGMDFIPVSILFIVFLILFHRMPMEGRVEGWNMPIMSWMNAIAWVPNHVASALACLTGFLLFQDAGKKGFQSNVITSFFIGACFASGLGLSVWVTFTFAIFWAVWMIVLAFQKAERHRIGWMVFSGLTAIVFAAPFLLDLFSGGSGAGPAAKGLPIEFYVRPFIATSFLLFLPESITPWFDFLFLPINYYLELGFFAVIAVEWLKLRRKTGFQGNPYYLAEFLLACVVTILMSFFRSTIIYINDWGIRGWLPLQFILIVWVMDLYSHYRDAKTGETRQTTSLLKFKSLGPGLQVLLIVGVMTTMLEVIVDRSWNLLIDSGAAGTPHEVGPDLQIGERTYYARLAYEYANQELPQNIIYQNNPGQSLDRPAGLYGTRQMVLADRSTYGVPLNVYLPMANKIGSIFTINYWDWGQIDATCKQYNIGVMVINDLDPIWNSLPTLEKYRKPLYQNKYYTLIACGNFAGQ